MAILFYVKDIKYVLSGKRKIKEWIKTVIDLHHKETGEISIILTEDNTLLDLNNHFLKRNYYTDIITFDYSKDKIITGDLFISIERIKENANKYKVTAEQELKRVIIHGILHLLGYRDNNKKEKKEMRMLEEKYLKILE